MKCPECNSLNTRVTCTEQLEASTKRYCRCLDCKHKYRTYERYEKYRRGPKPGGRLLDTQGSKNGFAVLTEDNIREIRQLKSQGKTNFHISVVYGINRGHVSRIVNRKVWAHVD
jgi:DNA invertase Pin-like site-specific DNA recombinase